MNITLTKDGGKLTGNEWDALRSAVMSEIERIVTGLEEKFGPRDGTYPSITVNFNSGQRIDTVVDETRKTISINLPAYEMHNDENSLYQRRLNLCHELTHTITPCRDPNKATFLDEGLATVFSEEYTGAKSGAHGKYREARDLVLKLLELDNEVIRKLRVKYPDRKISEYTLQDVLGELSPSSSATDIVQKLLKPFNATQ
jgi:hypothetical protein